MTIKIMKFVGFALILLWACCAADDPVVYISATDPIIDPTEGVIIQKMNKDVQLTCVVENKPNDAEVQWLVKNPKNKVGLVQISDSRRSYDHFHWAIDNPSSTAWRLRIQNVQETDEGKYICRVQVVSQSYASASTSLKVVQVPQISDLDTSNDMTKSSGESAILECYATGRPKPLIKWTRMAGELLPNGGKEFFGNELRIDRIEYDDAGKYRCTATNSAGSDSRVIRITVNFRPEVRSGGTIRNQVRQKEGYPKTLTCDIKGFPQPDPNQISWQRENQPINPEKDSKYEIMHVGGAYNRITSLLVIKKVGSSDFGEFSCTASNDKGSATAYIELLSSPMPTEDGYRIGAGTPALVSLSLTLFSIFIAYLLH